MFVFSLVEDTPAELPYFLWSSLDVSDIVMVVASVFYDREGIFVGGVEGHFGLGAVLAFSIGVVGSSLANVLNGLIELN